MVVAAPRRALLLAALIGAGLGVLLGGPVAGVALAGYGWLGARALVRRQAARQADRLRRKRLDQLCGLAADLRAGLPVLVAAERLGLTATGQTSDAPVWASAGPDQTGTGAASHPRSTRVAGRAAVRVGRAAGRDRAAPPAPCQPVTNTGPGRAPLRTGAGGSSASALAGEVLPVADAGPPANGPAGWPVIDGAERVSFPPVPHAPGWSAVGSEPTSTVDAASGPGSCEPVVEPAGAESRRDGPGRRRPRAGEEPSEPDRLLRLALAAVRLADRTGAPLAELVERIEADARSTDRGLAAAAAQAAGARATAWLLAALPLGGVGLGYGIGVDPVAVLLHTPIGGTCAVAAIVLQVAGLLWTERLGGTPGRAG
ncbi:type II secretion system F family protein [Micromonospora echinaurantiaca]|uniref:type II secretion system F family protein n=1 Tax=Micromonospora echinaurantiaca TaxID=47857 RepID=UPI002F918B0D